MKTVAIIGAGPSGLVTAKTLIHSKSTQYKVRIFEKQSEIGGLWAVHRDRPYDGMLNPQMPTNLSRFNIGFSDLAWSSVGLEGHVNYWPRAWQVGKYLGVYVRRYIPDECFSFNVQVTDASLVGDDGSDGAGGDEDGMGDVSRKKWRLRWQSTDSGSSACPKEGIFDHLVIATGLFGASSMPEFVEAKEAGIKVVHSTKLRRLEDVAPEDTNVSGTILVVGGGMSGGDASTLLATHLSDALYAPSSDGKKYSGLKLVQLCPDKAYALPLAAPSDQTNPSAPEFLPLDLCMYQLGSRPAGDIDLNVGKSSKETIQRIHDAFRGIVGDQSDLHTPLLTYDDTSTVPYVTLTELYSGFIRSGNINIVEGRLESLRQTGESGRIAATVKTDDRTDTIKDLVGIVYATGFTPQPSLNFLSQEVRKLLAYDANHNRLPIVLDEYATISHAIPQLAVVGFHEGAFWGSMEMEARLAVHRWNKSSIHGESENNKSKNKVTIISQSEDLLDLRTAMTNRERDIPQYWLGDYVGLMETLAREVGIQREDFNWPERTGPVTIYRYSNNNTIDDTNNTTTNNNNNDNNKETSKSVTALQIQETQTSLQEFLELLHDSKTNAKFVPRAIFLSLQGTWTLHRKITSKLSTMPSGTLQGKATFHPRHPTDPSSDFEFLYIENGTFTFSHNSGTESKNEMKMQASRRYIYRYSEPNDKISIFFVNPSNNLSAENLYHSLSFSPTPTLPQKSIDNHQGREGDHCCWQAQATDHLCIDDLYRAEYRFWFRGAVVRRFEVVHFVRGPRKDYVSEAVYSRI